MNDMDKKFERVYETSIQMQTARKVLMNLHDLGLLRFNSGKGKDNKVYDDVEYDLYMRDDMALTEWLMQPNNMHIRYTDYEHDKKGRLVKCRAERM